MSHFYTFGSAPEEQYQYVKYCMPTSEEQQQQQKLQNQQVQFNSMFPFEEIEGDEFLSFSQLPPCEDESDKIDEIMTSMTAKMNSNNEQGGSSASLKTEMSLSTTIEHAPEGNMNLEVPSRSFNYSQNYAANVPVPREYPVQQIQQPYQSYQVSEPQQSFYFSQQVQQYPTVARMAQDSAKHIDYYSIYEQQCNEKLKQQSQNTASWNQNQLNNNSSMFSNSACNFNTYPQNPADIYGCPHLETSHSNSYSSASSHCGDSDHHTLPLFSFPEPTKNAVFPAENKDNFDFFSYFQTSNLQDSLQKQEITECIPAQQDSSISRNISQSTAHSAVSPSSSSRTVSQVYFLQVVEKEQPQLESIQNQEVSANPPVLLPQNPDFYSAQRKSEITAAMRKSNKKNVVRNLMRAFKQYFLQKHNNDSIMRTHFQGQSTRDVQQKFKRYFAQRKFNHNSIKQLVQHEKYGDIFHQFLKEHSQAYLKNSFVKMQELHQVFIDFLLLCFHDEELLDSLETYSKIKNPFL